VDLCPGGGAFPEAESRCRMWVPPEAHEPIVLPFIRRARVLDTLALALAYRFQQVPQIASSFRRLD